MKKICFKTKNVINKYGLEFNKTRYNSTISFCFSLFHTKPK